MGGRGGQGALWFRPFLRGQGCLLQIWVSLEPPRHGLPPRRARILMVRSRERNPPPHRRLHADQGPKALYSQSTGGPAGGKAGIFEIFAFACFETKEATHQHLS